MKFRKKPIVIEAIQSLPENIEKILEWSTQERPITTQSSVTGEVFITTLEGVMKANKGDWIIRGVSGEIYPCKPDIFEKTYEPV